MSKNTREYNREYQRRRRIILQARGLCSWCGKVDVEVDKNFCTECLDAMRKRSSVYYRSKRNNE